GRAGGGEEEPHEPPRRVRGHASAERVATLDAVNKPVLAQKLERAVDGNRCGPRAFGREPVHDLVGAKRPVADQERRQDVAADRGQALATLAAALLGDRHGVGGAAVMVVPRSGKYPSPSVLLM